MEERKLLSILGIVVIAAALFANADIPSGTAINVTDNATISITLNTKTMIDISPNNMSFGVADPGTRIANYTNNELAGVSKTGFQLENIGSTNITNLWLNVTQPTVRPFATGDSGKYDAANFIAAEINMSPDGSAITQNTMSFIDRLEYNETRELVYLNLPADTKSHGRLRSGHNEYFWALHGDTSQCNASSAGTLTFTIGTVAHNQTQTGTIDLASASVETFDFGAMYESGYNANWSYSTDGSGVISIDTPSSDYCVAAYIDCSKVRIFRWNADAPGAGTCGLSGDAYTYNSTSTELLPGDSMAMNIEMRVPFGTALGDVKTGYLTVIAQSSASG